MNLIKKKKSPLLAKIKFEPTFFQVLWRFAFSLPLLGEAGGRGVRSLPFRPPSPLMKSVRIFSNTYRQSVKVLAGSPSTRARHPILNAKLNFLSLFRKAERQKRAFHFLFDCFHFIWYHYIERIAYHLHTIKLLKIWQQKSILGKM